MSDEQLDETSISQGHSTFGSCDRICMFMCEYGNLILKLESLRAVCLQVFFLVALVQRKKLK